MSAQSWSVAAATCVALVSNINVPSCSSFVVNPIRRSTLKTTNLNERHTLNAIGEPKTAEGRYEISSGRETRGLSWTDSFFAEYDLDDYENDGYEEMKNSRNNAELVDRVHAEASSVAGIRTATGSEVSEMINPKRIPTENTKRKSPKRNKALNKTTTSRKAAIPKQTPKKESMSDRRPPRIDHEEEIRLANIIQRGSEIHRIKVEYERKHERTISRQKWTELAKVESPNELRRFVSDYRRAKTTLVTANMGLVHAVVNQVYGQRQRNMGVSKEEMVQEGSLGLIRAAELFDSSRGLKFSTYATIWIKGILSNSGVGEAITLPLREKNKWSKIRKASNQLMAEHNGDQEYQPKTSELAKLSGLSEKEVVETTTRMSSAQNILSLDFQYNQRSRSGMETDSTQNFMEKRALTDDTDLAETLSVRADVVAALTKNLEPSEAQLMRLRYGLTDGRDRTLLECANEMGITKNRATYLASKCLKKLREADDAKSLQEYLLTVA